MSPCQGLALSRVQDKGMRLKRQDKGSFFDFDKVLQGLVTKNKLYFLLNIEDL